MYYVRNPLRISRATSKVNKNINEFNWFSYAAVYVFTNCSVCCLLIYLLSSGMMVRKRAGKHYERKETHRRSRWTKNVQRFLSGFTPNLTYPSFSSALNSAALGLSVLFLGFRIPIVINNRSVDLQYIQRYRTLMYTRAIQTHRCRVRGLHNILLYFTARALNRTRVKINENEPLATNSGS